MLLKIRQVYNNNSARVQVGDGREAVVQGKGISYGKRRGDTISSAKAQHILYLGDERMRGQFTDLLKDIPIDIVVTVFSVIDTAKTKYHMPLLNYVYVTLSDHVFQMYKKLMSGKYKPSLAPDVRSQYPREYELAEDAVRQINQNLGVYFPSQEVKSIALHFINAQGEENDPEPSADMIADVNRIVQEVFAQYQIQRNVDNRNFFDRLMIHLQYLVERVQDNELDSEQIDSEIGRDFRRRYPESTSIAAQIAVKLEDQLKIKLNGNERLYFVIHIQRLIKENEEAQN